MNTRSIEDKIDALFNTGGANTTDNDADDQNTSQQNNEQQEHANDEAAEQAAEGEGNAAGGQAARQDANTQRDNNTGEGGAQQRRQEHRGGRQDTQGQQPPQRRLPANNNGDLIDPRTGQVVARAGNERRYYEAARNAATQVQRVTADFARVNAELAAYREAAAMPTQLGLSPVEATNAMQWFAHWKKDPVAAAQNVLTELRAMGHTIEGLEGQVDMAAIRRMVNEAVSPLVGDREAAQREAQIVQNVDQELTAFYGEFQWAQGQQEEIISLMDAMPTLTLREAALRLENYALQNGYDLSKPLREQILAAQNGGSQQPQMPQRPNNARMPAPSMTGDVPLAQRRVTSASHDRTSRDIVREAMREAGLNVDNL